MSEAGREFVLTVSCPDRTGITHAVSGVALENDLSIADSQQFADPTSGEFHLRMHLTRQGEPTEVETVRESFARVVEEFDMTLGLHDASERQRVVLMVSRQGHCLNDRLFRVSTGQLPIDVAAIVSTHEDFRGVADWYGLPFHHVPVTKETKPQAEAELLRIIEETKADTVVLARYMQVLSEDLCARLSGRVINIHHSLLPSFKGAKPYTQAHERGVKVIGATAHYVTADLDEGPIIAQTVQPVTHAQTPADFVERGRDVEGSTLVQAVRWHAEHRVLVDGRRTVVFS